MIPNNLHIEENLLAHGKSLWLKENQTIALRGEECKYIIFLDQATTLKINGNLVDIQAGIYLNVREFFNNDVLKNTIITIYKTKAILIESEVFDRKRELYHQFQLFFLRKLSQQAPIFQTVFE